MAGWDPSRSVAERANLWAIVGIISIPTFVEVLDTSIANVSVEYIAGGLAISNDQATWVLTSYLVANAIVIPISDWVSDVIGRKSAVEATGWGGQSASLCLICLP